MSHSIRWIIVIALLMPVTINISVGQEKSKQRLEFGGWTLTAQPYRGTGHESNPVEVVSLAIKDAGNEFQITDLVLKNHSSKIVRSVEINWRLVKNENNESTVLKTGFSTERRFPNNLSAGKGVTLRFTVIKIPKMMFSQEELNGDCRIEVAVTNVFYADGTSLKPRRLLRQI